MKGLKSAYYLVILFSLMMVFACGKKSPKADLIITKANIWTGDTQQKTAQAMAIMGGKLADFVILSDDLFKIEPTKIKDMEVLATYVGGKKVYEK